MKWIRPGVFLCGLAACGGTGDGDDTEDARASGKASVASITPSDGSRHVGVLSPVIVRLTAPVDVSSVDATSVALRLGDTEQAVVADIAYDCERGITITPAYPLTAGTDYHIVLAGITVAGLPVAPAESRFRTVENEITEQLYWDQHGVPWYDYRYTYDVQDRLRALVIHGAGGDGFLGNEDDDVEWISHAYPAADLERDTWYHAGIDGILETADDETFRVDVILSSAFGVTNQEEYDAPGPDGVWSTPDDRKTQVSRRTYDELGRLHSFSTIIAGADGVIGTADDLVDWSDCTYAAGASHCLSRVGAGADGAWFTADDDQGTRTDTTFDDRGGLVSTAYVDCGFDHRCGTTDDLEYEAESVARDARGSVIRHVWSSSAGRDLIWGNADDQVLDYELDGRDDRGNLETVEVWQAGADGAIGGADDNRTYLERHDTAR